MEFIHDSKNKKKDDDKACHDEDTCKVNGRCSRTEQMSSSKGIHAKSREDASMRMQVVKGNPGQE